MSHYDIHVCDIIKYPEMVMARTAYGRAEFEVDKKKKTLKKS